MLIFGFELRHSLRIWRRYFFHLLLLPLMLSTTLVMLLFGFSLHQQVMSPAPSAANASSLKQWSLGLQDDAFNTTAFNPAQIRQLSNALNSDFQLAKLAFGELQVSNGQQEPTTLSAVFIDKVLSDSWPGAAFIRQLNNDNLLLSHRLARQWLASHGELPELLEIDGIYFRVGGVAPSNWTGIAHIQADLWLSNSAHTMLLQQRLQRQFEKLPNAAKDASTVLPSFMDVSPQFYLLAISRSPSANAENKLQQVMQEIDWSNHAGANVGQYSFKITQRPLHSMLLPGIQLLPAQYNKVQTFSYMLIAQATLLLILSLLQSTILLLSKHLQRQSEWQTRFFLGLPRIQRWTTFVADLLPISILSILLYPVAFIVLQQLLDHHEFIADLIKHQHGRLWLQGGLFLLVALVITKLVLAILIHGLMRHFSRFSNIDIFQTGNYLQRAGSVIMLTGACFALSICLLNWQGLKQLTQNNTITDQQKKLSIFSLQQIQNGYYADLAADIRARGFQVAATSAAPLRPINEFYQFTLTGSSRTEVELGVVKIDLAAPEILDLTLISGRWMHEFAINECVISQQGLRLLDANPEEILQQQLLNDLPVIGNCEVVGVASDVHFGNLNEPVPSILYRAIDAIPSQLYLVSQAEPSSIMPLFNQINTHPKAGITDQWLIIELIKQQSEQELSFFRLTMILMVCATLLFLAGLFVEQALLMGRLGKEAAIRTALGSNTRNLLIYLLREPSQTILVSMLLLSMLLIFTLKLMPLFKISSWLVLGNLSLMLLCLITIMPLLWRLRKHQIKQFL